MARSQHPIDVVRLLADLGKIRGIFKPILDGSVAFARPMLYIKLQRQKVG
jgi:hypothetical protein